ncbi:hypothetical protein SAMN04488063_0973 [Halopelagius inordinatus]|uniref:Uncharacterized protein n=1 Tax=Halopelagius inordinatus TaxID=553467 RepID=A0A1I2N2K2_9EURY|nr:hypothetical protein [Halopelagius inordinatus]SFF97079.1 hypothetical protein SAMN04488063_0973 [Halopelagius inordinatus]
MALSDYAGRSPKGRDATVVRVAPHRLWRPGGERVESCAYSGEELSLSERHLLVVLDVGDDRVREYVRDESCLRAWLNDE